MGADLSRIRSNPLLDFSGVELKQGGVLLDADFNELVAIVDRRLRALASDTLGRATVSSTTPDAFKLSVVAGALQIAAGRLYVDGLLAENHGLPSDELADKGFDPLLAETRYSGVLSYSTQPYLPSPPALPTGGRHLVYLDVWDRELTHIERPALVETAVGVETSSRKQTVWQVRVLADDAGNATCASPDADLPGWGAVIAPSSGRLTTGSYDVPPAGDPCELPPSGGYRGLENQTYRVEIHDAGLPGGTATFKWARDNASVGSRVAAVVSGSELQLETLGRDDVLRFNSDDWVEITDDTREFAQASGEMRKITVIEASRRITFTPALPADLLPGINLRVRRWDQKHEVLQAGSGGSTSVFQDLDADDAGVVNVPAAGTTLLLEHGVTVTFASTAGGAGFKAGDFWVFAARTADASVEALVNEPPRGIHHHHARLGLWDVAAGTVTDCRHPWPPSGEGHDCSCTECVTPESHANGSFTLQDAVDRLRDTGGTVCLGVGEYPLRDAVRVSGARGLRIQGEGAMTLVSAPGTAFAIENGLALALEDLAIVSLGQGSAVTVRSVLGLRLQRLVIAVLGNSDVDTAAIALSGVVVDATLSENTVLAPIGVMGPSAAARDEQAASFLLSAQLRIENNLMWCQTQGIAIAGLALHLLATRIAGNQLLGCREAGMQLLGYGAPGSALRIEDNGVNVEGAGITAGVNGLWIEGNKLEAVVSNTRGASGAGITLQAGLDPSGIGIAQVLANQVGGFTGAGIAVNGPVRELIAKLNTVERCGNGIVLQDGAQAEHVAIENNHINDIGREGDEGEVCGVALLRTAAAAVAGNAIHRIGQTAARARLRAGIAAAGVQRLLVAGNQVADIAPAGSFEVGRGVGVLLRPPQLQADVNHNQIDRDAVPASGGGGDFMALAIEDLDTERGLSRSGLYTTLRIDAAKLLTLGAKRPFVTTASMLDERGAVVALPSRAKVLGNTLGARGQKPAVLVLASGDCQFSDNRCELRGDAKANAVQLTARTSTIVSANRVQGGTVSIVVDGNTKAATVLGNVTNHGIEFAAGSPLPTPWSALNMAG